MNIPIPFGERLKALRAAKGMSQKELALATRLSEARVSDYERGTRSPHDEQIAPLAQALGVSAEELTSGTCWTSSGERLALKRAATNVRRMFERPFRYRPPCDRAMAVQLKKALLRHPSLTRELLGIIARRDDCELLLRVLMDVVAGSAVEVLVHLTLLANGGLLVLVAPGALGYRQHPVVDPRNRRAVGDCEVPAYAIDLEGMRCLLIPQVGLACRKSTWCVDFLCAVIDKKGTVHWLYLEIDGNGHDATSDPARTADLNMPVVRLQQPVILRGDTYATLAEGIRAALPGASLAA